MKATALFLLMCLAAVATPAAAEWTPIGENTGGDQYFIDLATLKKGTRPRAWFMTNYPERSKNGVISNTALREVDCREEKIRILAGRLYTEPMGRGTLSGSFDQPGEWGYVTPNTMEAAIARIMCGGNQ